MSKVLFSTDERLMYEACVGALEAIDNGDEALDILSNAANLWCSNYDKCIGLKAAIKESLLDQFQNHRGENSLDDYKRLLSILSGKTNTPSHE